jgi:hypothetical protein
MDRAEIDTGLLRAFFRSSSAGEPSWSCDEEHPRHPVEADHVGLGGMSDRRPRARPLSRAGRSVAGASLRSSQPDLTAGSRTAVAYHCSDRPDRRPDRAVARRAAATEAVRSLGHCCRLRRRRYRPVCGFARSIRCLRARSSPRQESRTGRLPTGRTARQLLGGEGTSISAVPPRGPGRGRGSRYLGPELAQPRVSVGRSPSRRCAYRWDRHSSQRSHWHVLRRGVGTRVEPPV